MVPDWLAVSPAVSRALRDGVPIVALESTLIAHGLPWPANVETARAAEAAVRGTGAVPATIGVWKGRPTIGLDDEQIAAFAKEPGILKASRRELALAMARGATAATTVSATMFLAHTAGIFTFATGGIGGVHLDAHKSFDISADLTELSRTPVLVVCAGAKSILDLPRTLELLETLYVPVVGYRTSEFPAFYLRSSGLPLNARVETPGEAARLFRFHRELNGGGMLLAQPVAEAVALKPEEFSEALRTAQIEAAAQDIAGPAVTPFLLSQLATITQGRSLAANQALIVANARLAGETAVARGSTHLN